MLKGSNWEKIVLTQEVASSSLYMRTIEHYYPELHTLLDTERPDVVCGTESWLTPDISNSEILPPDLGYTMLRQDRIGNIGGWGSHSC